MTIKERIAALRIAIRYQPDEREIVDLLDALEKELEGEREWGALSPSEAILPQSCREDGMRWCSMWPSFRLVSRRKAGPWEEEPCPKK